jgi:hypothetical protein
MLLNAFVMPQIKIWGSSKFLGFKSEQAPNSSLPQNSFAINKYGFYKKMARLASQQQTNSPLEPQSFALWS